MSLTKLKIGLEEKLSTVDGGIIPIKMVQTLLRSDDEHPRLGGCAPTGRVRLGHKLSGGTGSNNNSDVNTHYKRRSIKDEGQP